MATQFISFIQTRANWAQLLIIIITDDQIFNYHGGSNYLQAYMIIVIKLPGKISMINNENSAYDRIHNKTNNNISSATSWVMPWIMLI